MFPLPQRRASLRAFLNLCALDGEKPGPLIQFMHFNTSSLFSWRAPLLLSSLALGAALLSAPDVDAQTGAAQPGAAQGAPEVKSQLTAFRVSRADDKETFVAAQNARPGDVIEYRVSYSNAGRGAALNLRPVLPIPVGTAYVANSAAPAPFEASLDGTTFAAAPLTRKVKKADGTLEVVNVPLAEYRALRWNAGTLAPRETNNFKARVQLAKAN